jgi:hypothetical protein
MPGSIKGVVTDPAQAPVQNASVTATMQGGAGQPIVVKTDAQGVYSVPNIPPGTYDLTVEAPLTLLDPPVTPVQVLQAAVKKDFPLTARPPSIVGVVTDPAGAAVKNATVTATPVPAAAAAAPAPAALPAVQTNSKGIYVVVAQAGNYSVSVQGPPNFQNPPPAAVTVAQGAIQQDFKLVAGAPAGVGSITGTIKKPDGTPAAGIQVTAKSNGIVLGPVPTAPDGTFTIPGAAPGNYSIELAGVQGAHTPAAVAVTVAAGAPTVVDFALQPILNLNDGAEFGKLRDLFRIKKDRFAPEPPVNLDEAAEMTRLYMAGTLIFAGLAAAITQLFDANLNPRNNNGGVSSFNGLALRKTANRGQWGRGKLGDPAKPLEQFDVSTVAAEIKENENGATNNKADLMRALRSGFAFGRASVEPPINSEFLEVFKRFVDLSTDDRNGIDPEKVKPGGAVVADARQYEQVRTFLREYKRSIIRLVSNLSLAGSAGTTELSEKWSGIVRRAMEVIDDVAITNVVSTDKDAQYAWTVLAALTAKDRSYVKRYVVHADSGTQLMRDAIDIYDKIQALGLLSDESDKSLRDIFIQPGFVFPGQTVAERVLVSASVLKDNWISDWNVEV